MFQGVGGTGGAHRLHVQYRWQQLIDDAGGAVRGGGHGDSFDAGAAAYAFRGGGVDVEGSIGRQGAAFIAWWEP